MMKSKDLYIELGKRIKALRNENKVTQAELAEALNLQRTSITNIEAGKQSAPLHVYYNICSYFNENLIDLVPANFSAISRINIDSITTQNDITDDSPKLAESIRRVSQRFEQHPLPN